MEVLITGASGLVGSAVARCLLKRNDVKKVLQYFNPLNPQLKILVRPSSIVKEFENEPRCEIIRSSFDDVNALKQACAGVNIIIHCAAAVSDWGKWEEFYQTNVVGTTNIVAAAMNTWKNGTLQRYTHISTTDVYGYPTTAKDIDESKPLIKTDLPYNSMSCVILDNIVESKVMAEEIVWKASSEGLPVTVIRPSNVFGPGSKDFVIEVGEAIKDRVMPYINGGHTSAGMVYVDNLAEGIIQATLSTKTVHQAYNIVDTEEASWKDYCEALAAGLGYRKPWLSLPFWLVWYIAVLMEFIFTLFGIKSRPLLTRHAVYLFAYPQDYCNSKAIRDFGYTSKVPYDEAMKRTIAWARSLKQFKK